MIQELSLLAYSEISLCLSVHHTVKDIFKICYHNIFSFVKSTL